MLSSLKIGTKYFCNCIYHFISYLDFILSFRELRSSDWGDLLRDFLLRWCGKWFSIKFMITRWIYNRFCLRIKDSKEEKRISDLKVKKVHFGVSNNLDSDLETNHMFGLVRLRVNGIRLMFYDLTVWVWADFWDLVKDHLSFGIDLYIFIWLPRILFGLDRACLMDLELEEADFKE